MTDAEIRDELKRKVEQDGRSVVLDSPADGPPLMLVYRARLRPEAIINLRNSWEAVWKQDSAIPKLIVLEDIMELFQLIGGEWRKIG